MTNTIRSKNLKLLTLVMLAIAAMLVIFAQPQKSLKEQIIGDPETVAMLETVAKNLANPAALQPYLHPVLPLAFISNPMVANVFGVGEMVKYNGITSVMAHEPDAGDVGPATLADVQLDVVYEKGGALFLTVQLRKDEQSEGQWKVSHLNLQPKTEGRAGGENPYHSH